jgi:hypothetical protein
MAGVVSVQRFQLTLTAGNLTASDTLAGGTNTDNCVPFITKRVTTPPDASGPPSVGLDDHRFVTVDAYFTGGDTVVVATNESADRVVVVEVTVVEFDGTTILVEHGTFGINQDTTDAVGITDIINVDQAFLYATWQTDYAQGYWTWTNVRCEITNKDLVTFDMINDTPISTGNFYVVRSVSKADFAVQQVSISLTTAVDLSGTDTFTAVDEAKSFVVGSYYGGSSDDNNDSTIHVALSNVSAGAGELDTVTIERQNTGGPIEWTGFIVTFDSGGAETVQRDTEVLDGDPNFLEVELGDAKDFDVKHIINSGLMGGTNGGSWDSSNGDGYCEAHAAWSWVDSDTIRVEHYTRPTPVSTDNRISWEVIEWELNAAGGPTRRVMVIS